YGFMSVLMATGGDTEVEAFRTPDLIASVYNGGNTLTRILALVLGVMAMGAEYRHRTMGWSYLGTPRRLTVVAAKTVVVLGFGAVYGVINAVAGVIAAIPLVHFRSEERRVGKEGGARWAGQQ